MSLHEPFWFTNRVLIAGAHLLSVRIKAPYFAVAITGKGYTGTQTTVQSRLAEGVRSIRLLPRVLGAWLGALIVALIITEVDHADT